jgi:molybdopterin synthase catalytic subunit
MFQATEKPIVPDLLLTAVQKETSGAVVSFVGVVRAYAADGRSVLFVECDGERDVVEAELRRTEDELRARWQLDDVALCHRLGQLRVGETILVVAVAAPHRQQAFEACQYAVQRVKESIGIREALA